MDRFMGLFQFQSADEINGCTWSRIDTRVKTYSPKIES
nr:hypothetical protein [Acinetobacter sp. 251-1]